MFKIWNIIFYYLKITICLFKKIKPFLVLIMSIKSQKILIILLTILPLVWIILAAINDLLGPNPVQKSIFISGWWALFFLQLTITIPLIDRFFNPSFIKIRRGLGLGTFMYASIHLFIWLLIENYQDFENIINELILIV